MMPNCIIPKTVFRYGCVSAMMSRNIYPGDRRQHSGLGIHCYEEDNVAGYDGGRAHLGAWTARGDVLTIGDTQDVNVASGSGLEGDNLSGQPEFLVNWGGAATSSQGLIQFDLSDVCPPAAVIQSATLDLFHEDNDGNGDTISLFRNTSAWSESTTTFSTAPSTFATAVSSLAISDDNTFLYRSFDVTAVVQGWFSGAFVNDGLTVTLTPDQPNWIYLMGHRGPADEVPILTITYAVPEPSSLALCGLGAVPWPATPGGGWPALRRRRPGRGHRGGGKSRAGHSPVRIHRANRG